MNNPFCILFMVGVLVFASCGADPQLDYPTTFVATDYELLADRRVSLVTNGSHTPTVSPRVDASFDLLDRGEADLTGLIYDEITIVDESTASFTVTLDGEVLTGSVPYTLEGDIVVLSDGFSEDNIYLELTQGGAEICMAFYNSVTIDTFQGATQALYDSYLGFCRSDDIDRDAVMDSLARLYNPFDTIAFFQIVQRFVEE